MQCSVHKGRIRGRVHRWNNRPMCTRCYGYFTQRVRVLRRPRSMPHRQMQQQNSSLLQKLRALLG
jgi:hypothetical protein